MILALVLIIGVIYLLPTLLTIGSEEKQVQGALGKVLPAKVINLGLDLKGGIYLAMEVDLQVALNNAARRTTDDLRRRLTDAKIPGFNLQNEDSVDIVLELEEQSALPQVMDLLDDQFPSLQIVSNDGSKLTLTFTAENVADIKDLTTRQALETIRNRVDMFGVAEPDIRPQGEDRIIIQLPGVADPDQAVALIGKTAILEFKLVDNGLKSAEQALRDGPP
ncbi:MAG: protein translocase subunit SecD, partial [Deltaproteobacteria bacterium]|nr:protein translocase subunit SecD [Deltaproteobacteria bacterium]